MRWSIKGSGLPGSSETHQASQAGWIRVVQVMNSSQMIEWQTDYSLGAGEVSTIALAKEINASIALMDERQARLLAKSAGVDVLGTVCLLELAYSKGEIVDLRVSYQKMIAVGARIDRRILNQSLAGLNLPTL